MSKLHRDIRAVANALEYDNGVIVLGDHVIAERLYERGWAREPKEHGSGVWGVWGSTLTPLGKRIQKNYQEDMVGYNHKMTPEEFVSEMQDRGRLGVPKEVFHQLEALRESGIVNMITEVEYGLRECGFDEALEWFRNNQEDYYENAMSGRFYPKEDGDAR